ncbi:MAG: hypothetical protein RJB38_2194 [Pseudomonadota bacterium]
MKQALVLSGEGLNCEIETALACQMVGIPVVIRSLQDLIAQGVSQERLCQDYGALLIPGGFSFGDEWDSGRILALKIRSRLKWNLEAFARQGGWVLGVCNGFQCLIRLGIFGAGVSITQNASGAFLNRWVELEVTDARGWLAGLERLELPIRHGEGRVVESPGALARSEACVALRYTQEINGSFEQAAALSTVEGRVLGMMPHPEAAFFQFQNPSRLPGSATAFEQGVGAALFRNLARGLSGLEGGARVS